MIHGVLKHFHPMVGCDRHQVMPPGSTLTSGPVPHFATAPLMGTGATAQVAPTEFTHFGCTVMKGSDIGPLIPHAGPPNCLLPVILATSGSKAEFGSSRYLVRNKPVAAALEMFVSPNLNCGHPVPAPFDGVIALTGHFVGMTVGDIVAGGVGMLADTVLVYAVDKLGGAFEGVSQRIYERFLFGPMCSMFERMGAGTVSTGLLRADFQEMMAKGFAAKLGQLVAGDAIGSPLGYSFPANLFGWADVQGKHQTADSFSERAYEAIRGYLDRPSVETHGVPPPPDAAGPDAMCVAAEDSP